VQLRLVQTETQEHRRCHNIQVHRVHLALAKAVRNKESLSRTALANNSFPPGVTWHSVEKIYGSGHGRDSFALTGRHC
jgi:hypothetical protein